MVFDIAGFLSALVQDFGLFGLFIASIIANASLFLPLPIDVLVFLLGSTQFFNPLFIAFAAALGAVVGEFVGYAVGLGGHVAVRRVFSQSVEKIESFRERIKKTGMLFIIIFSFIPFPFDLIGIASGMIRYDWKKFAIAVFVGKFLRYSLIAAAGFYSLSFLARLLGI
jgi:membrane protein YqaA with SNARE-associated domain